jgi:preprotein translocase subunit SecF
MINIIGKRYIFITLSLVIIIPGLIILAALAIRGELPLAIDFTGGSLLEMKFPDGNLPSTEDVLEIYSEQSIDDVSVQTTDQGSIIIRSTYLEDAQRSAILQNMQQKSSENVEVLRFENVGPVIGKEVATRAALAVSVAAIIVVIYMTYAFRGMQHSLRYGICAVIAMLHDVAIVLSLTAIGSLIFGWQIDALFLTALLTVIGFSVQDKVVVFDRIRENSTLYRKLNFETLVNHSIVQTLQRSINTQLMTVEFMLLSLALFGGVTLREFAIILLVGLLSGTYSSIFTASPILVIWENREWKTWFRPKPKATVEA